MKTGKALGLVTGLGAVLVAAHAMAVAWTDWTVVGEIDTDPTLGAGGFYFRPATPLPDNSHNNPAHCGASGSPIAQYNVSMSGTQAADRDAMYKVLTSALLSGRKIGANLVTTGCVGGSPTFTALAISAVQ